MIEEAFAPVDAALSRRGDSVKPRLLVVGLGNPILGDDSVGWRIVERLASSIKDPLIETDCLAVGGLVLMERLLGFREAILVDAVTTGLTSPGSLQRFTPADLPPQAVSYTRSIHDTGLSAALQVGRSLNADLPRRIEIVAVEILPSLEFSEDLTPPVAAAVPHAQVLIGQLIRELIGRSPILCEDQTGG